MPENFKQKVLFMILNLIGSLSIMLIVLSATNRIGKADVEYVDKQDQEIRNGFVSYKSEHQIQHSNEYRLMQSEVAAVKSNQELMMKFWGIEMAK